MRNILFYPLYKIYIDNIYNGSKEIYVFSNVIGTDNFDNTTGKFVTFIIIFLKYLFVLCNKMCVIYKKISIFLFTLNIIDLLISFRHSYFFIFRFCNNLTATITICVHRSIFSM